MVTKLFVPERRIVVPKPPSYLKLDMAFAIGAGAKLMDKSRYRSHATIVGADWDDGVHGKCLTLVTANSDYVAIPAAYTQLDFTSEDFSCVMRIKPTDISVEAIDLYRGEYNKKGWWFYINSLFQLDFRTFQSGVSQITSSLRDVMVNGTWYTIGFSRDGAAVKIYLNGVDATAVSGTHIDPVTADSKLLIGTWHDETSRFHSVSIEFLRIFGGIALPASAHLAWHNALA